MKEYRSTDQPFDEPVTEEGSGHEWEEDVVQDEFDREFDQLLEKHKELIERITPVDPIISKDDEWNDEDFWEEDYKQQCLEDAEKVGELK